MAPLGSCVVQLGVAWCNPKGSIFRGERHAAPRLMSGLSMLSREKRGGVLHVGSGGGRAARGARVPRLSAWPERERRRAAHRPHPSRLGMRASARWWLLGRRAGPGRESASGARRGEQDTLGAAVALALGAAPARDAVVTVVTTWSPPFASGDHGAERQAPLGSGTWSPWSPKNGGYAYTHAPAHMRGTTWEVVSTGDHVTTCTRMVTRGHGSR